MADTQNESLDGGMVVAGFLMGLLIGGGVALFRAPHSGDETRQRITSAGQQIRERIEVTVTPADPVADSIAEGKAAARRRRSELGFE